MSISGSFAESMMPHEGDEHLRQKTVERCQNVVRKLLDWAERSGLEIKDIKKLGGYTNLVLMIHTADGTTLVAKAFEHAKDAQETRDAQKVFLEIADQDQPMVPSAVAWVDDMTLVSKKAEGVSVREIFTDVVKGARNHEEASKAFDALGATLGAVHERTERPYTDSDSESQNRYDSRRIRADLDDASVQELLRLTPETIERVKNAVAEIALLGFVTLNHGDAHLEQFFKAPDKSHVMIVDYDKFRYGDPMADIARAISSLRCWSWILKAPLDLERDLTSEFVKGYRRQRKESLLTGNLEFDQAKIIAYELRQCLMLLRWNDKAIKTIHAQTRQDFPDIRSFLDARLSGELDEVAMEGYGFDVHARLTIEETAFALAQTEEVARYLDALKK